MGRSEGCAGNEGWGVSWAGVWGACRELGVMLEQQVKARGGP